MSRPKQSPEREVDRYLRTGECDHFYSAWPGKDLFTRAKHGNAALRGALISTVRSRTAHTTPPREFANIDVVALTRKKVEPMVRGLFSHVEQDVVLNVLGCSVVFLSPATIDTVLSKTPWPGTAWMLANLYLASCNAEPLSEDAPRIVGLSLETTCYVSLDYFRTKERLSDFVLHEAAHIFHNCKRRTIGLREIRGREWLLDIDFTSRETFAYACEAYGRIIELVESGRIGERSLLRSRMGQCRPMTAWMQANTSISFARLSLIGMVGSASLRDAHRAGRQAGAGRQQCNASYGSLWTAWEIFAYERREPVRIVDNQTRSTLLPP
jgi:hypothetical protein